MFAHPHPIVSHPDGNLWSVRKGGGRDQMAIFKWPHHERVRKKSQYSCTQKESKSISFWFQNRSSHWEPKAGKSTSFSMIGYLVVRHKHKYSPRESKEFLGSLWNPAKEHFQLANREATNTFKMTTQVPSHHFLHKGNGCFLKVLFVWIHIIWLSFWR